MNWRKLVVLAFILVPSLGVYVSEVAAQTVIDDCSDDPSQPGSYLVTANLSSSGDCLVVGADNVTIDLNGFQIERTGTGGAAAGIRLLSGSQRGITIRNGTIKGFAFGINLSGSTGCLIENIVANGNTSAGIRVANGCVVRGNVAFGNNAGIVVGDGNIVTGNNSSFNTLGVGNGISVGLDNVVASNVTTFNVNDGITTNPAGSTNLGSNYVENIANDNGGDGLEVGCPSYFGGNVAQRNRGLNLNQIGLGCKKINDNAF